MMTVTPIKKLTEANDGSLECQCKGGNESVPTRVACSACGMATQKKSLSKMEMQNMVCFRYCDIGHFAKHCPLKRLRPTRVNTISKATPTKRTTAITCGKGKKTQIIANKGIKHSKVQDDHTNHK